MGGLRIAPYTMFGKAQPQSLGFGVFLPYFGDRNDITTLYHNLWMAGIASNITISDVMDINNKNLYIKYHQYLFVRVRYIRKV